MSLINQMLRDLDERQASTLERSGLAAQVRALPPEKRFPWMSVLPVAVGFLVGAAGLWMYLSGRQSSSPPEAPVPVAQPAAPTAAIAMPPLVVPMPGDIASSPVDASIPVEKNATAKLQMDFRLPQPDSERRQATPAPNPPVAAAQVAAPAAIDKRLATPAVTTADTEYAKAMAAYRQGRPNEALEGFQSALRLDTRHILARQALLSQLMEQRRWQEAQAVAAEGLTLVAAQPGWAMILARLQVEQGQVAEAEQTMSTYARYGERSADYLAFHGLLLEKLQRPQEAREVFVKAREIGSLPPDLAAAVEQRLH